MTEEQLKELINAINDALESEDLFWRSESILRDFRDKIEQGKVKIEIIDKEIQNVPRSN